MQADIVCGDGNQAWYFRSKAHKAERADANGKTHPEPLNGLLNTVAWFEVSRLSHGQPVYGHVAMEYVDNNAMKFWRIRKVLTMTCGVVVSFNLSPMANQINSILNVCQNVSSSTRNITDCLTQSIRKQADNSLFLRRVCGLSCFSSRKMSGLFVGRKPHRSSTQVH